MRILMLSMEGDCLGMAYKLMLEDHHVDVWIKNPAYKKDLVGLVGRPREWKPLLPQADLIICDMVGFSQHVPLFQKLGKPFLCCNPVADVMELDRLKGLETFKRAGIEQPEYWHYTSPAEAASALPSMWNPDGLVLKPFGNIDCGKTYIVEDQELARWALSTYPMDTHLVVQRRIPSADSVEISTEGWFNGIEFITPFNHTLEEKRLMVGDVGRMTGCMGNLVFTTPGDKLVNATLRKIEPILKKAGYRGPVDINCIVTKDCAYGLEFTCRFGYDAIEALMQGLREPVANLLFETAIGAKKSMDITSDFLIAVRVCRDPYPTPPNELAKSDQDQGMPILGLNAKDLNHAYLCDVYLDSSGMLRYAAADGVILKATAFGRTVDEARSRAYTVVHNIKGIDIMYRTDIGLRADKDLERLRSWGWIN